ncbi:MAG: 2-isopropylmalate synthase [Terriglobia bacterium]
MEEKIYIFDTTLRDGEQSPGASMNLEEKLKMARQLEALRVNVIEAGFPIASDGDFEAVRQVAKEIRGVTIAGLARAVEGDIRRAWEALEVAERPRIHTFIATSDIHLKYKLKRDREQVLEQAAKAVRLARSLCDDVEFSAEDAGRSDLDYLCQIVELAIQEGATTINIPDTVGYCVPDEFGNIFKTLRERVPNIHKARLSSHCHDDLGLAVANSIAAIQNGARQIECTINGIGERAGNASLEEIVMALKVRKDRLGFATDVLSEEIYKASHLLSNLTGIMVQPNKAIVGKNAFAHEAGIHQDGVLKEALTYEIMTPQSVGIPTNHIVLGKHSGRHGLSKRYEALGYNLTQEELDRAYMLFTKLADKKKSIYDEDLLAIIHDGIRIIPERFHLKYVHATGGNQVLASATVRLERENETQVEAALGDGPIEAIYRAIDRITGIQGKLIDYSVHAVSKGKDAVGEVFVHVTFDGKSFSGKAASSDVIDASARAYLNAVNKAIYEREASPAHRLPSQSVSAPHL